jgi:hypothetical protein
LVNVVEEPDSLCLFVLEWGLFLRNELLLDRPEHIVFVLNTDEVAVCGCADDLPRDLLFLTVSSMPLKFLVLLDEVESLTDSILFVGLTLLLDLPVLSLDVQELVADLN